MSTGVFSWQRRGWQGAARGLVLVTHALLFQAAAGGTPAAHQCPAASSGGGGTSLLAGLR